MDQKVREQWRWPARASFLRTGLIGGSCHVEMCPFESLRELAEECRGRDGAAFPAGDVREVREVALELFAVFLGERKLPCAVVGARSGLHELTDQPVVVAHDASMMMPQCDHARTRECCDVHDDGGIEATRVVEGVAQDQATFGVRIQYLDRLPGGAGRDVARLDRLTA